MHVLEFEEHQAPCQESEEQKEAVKAFNALENPPTLPLRAEDVRSVNTLKYLGICKGDSLKASYYIGASWYQEQEIAFVVKPKVDVDYIKLFMIALEENSSGASEYFSNFYHIDFENAPIETKSLDNVITPLLILHYISLLTHLVSHGLKRGYVTQEENLQSKVRGKILLQKQLKKNVFAKREDRVYCRFQEFTEDIPENRLLKKALTFANHFICGFKGFEKYRTEVFPKLSVLNSAFERVSEEVTLAQVSKINAGKLYRHYESALKVAKLILRHFDYSIDNTAKENQAVRPFCIDMPRLYEMYVLHLLRKAYGDDIQFQVPGRCKTQVDFIKKSANEKLILDAKYKPKYDGGNAGILGDIREISGYARDEKILKALGWKPNVDGSNGDCLPRCVIIYPDKSTKFDADDDYADVDCEEISKFDTNGILNDPRIKPISGFKGFYKIAVPLPLKK